MAKWFFILIFTLQIQVVIGQCETIHLKGKVVDTVMHQKFFNLMVVNQTTKQGVYGKSNGEFSIHVRPQDKLAFSVNGYSKIFMEISDNGKCSRDTLIYLQRKVQEFEEVTVFPIKSLEKIKKEREELSFRETRTVKGLEAFKSPITALYERFSQTGTSKRLVAQMEYKDDITRVVKELLRTYVSYDVVYLKEQQFSDFIEFLNIDDYFLKNASEYELILYIQRELEYYKSMNPELFQK